MDDRVVTNRGTVLFLLFLASVLEGGGDAVIRAGLRSHRLAERLCLFALGACTLFAYGWIVNVQAWNFGRLLGVYIVFFFVTAQLIAWFGFAEAPSRGLLAGGVLIVAGGCVVALSQS